MEPEKMERGKSPFMKKHFNSTSAPPTENMTALTTNYSTKAYPEEKKLFLKKTESVNSNIKNSEINAMKPLIEARNRIKRGCTIIFELLTANNSKLTVNICCFVAKKTKELGTSLDREIKKIQADK